MATAAAYKLRRPANPSTWLVDAAAFLKHYGLEAFKGQRFPETVEGEMVVVVTLGVDQPGHHETTIHSGSRRRHHPATYQYLQPVTLQVTLQRDQELSS